MITETSTNETFTSTINAYPITGSDRYAVYTAGRVVIELQMATAGVVMFDINGLQYYTDASGYLAVDITDILRTLANNATADFDITQDADGFAWELRVFHGFAPDDVIMPPVPALAGIVSDTDGLQIVPPCTIYQHPVLSLAYPLYIELFGEEAAKTWTLYPYKNFQSDTSASIVNGQMTLPNRSLDEDWEPDWIAKLEEEDNGLTYETTLLRACDNAICLQWLSPLGVKKRAIWRVKRIKHKATETALLPLGDGYRQLRGQIVSLVAYIEGLDAYSAAYYADIITSPDVHATMKAGEDLDSWRTGVQVGTGDYTIADGDAGETQTLEVTINFKQYDAI